MLAKLGAVEGASRPPSASCCDKRAPVSGVQSLLDYQGRFMAETRAGLTTVSSEVAVPVKRLRRCSKEISDHALLD